MTVVLTALVYAAQVVFARITFVEHQWAVWWPMNGIALGVLLVARRRHWTWILIAFAVGIALTERNEPLRVIVIVALCNTLEVLGPALALPRFRSMDRWLAQPKLVADFIVLALIVAPTAASLLAPLYYHTRPGESYWLATLRWEAGDVLGIALYTPLVLALFCSETWQLFRPPALPRTFNLLSLMTVASWCLFHQRSLPIGFALYPIILMMGTQLGLSGASIALNVLAIIATSATLRGLGPFGALLGEPSLVDVLVLQFYLTLALSMTLPVSVARVRRLTTEKQLKLSLQKMEEFASLDGLTNVANRRRFDSVLLSEWLRGRRDRSSLALLMIDTDRFKLFNDYYGHLAGDACLRSVAQAIMTVPGRTSDLVARYGGEEFAVLLPGTDIYGACKVAEEVRRTIYALDLPHQGNDEQRVTISIGVAALVPDAKLEPLDLIAASDYALYQAKHGGRNRVQMAAGAAGAGESTDALASQTILT